MCSRHVFEPSNTRQPRDCFHDFVRPQVDDVQNPRTQVSREQEMILVVDSEIVEALSLRTGQIELRCLLQRLTKRNRRKQLNQQEQSSDSDGTSLGDRSAACHGLLGTLKVN